MSILDIATSYLVDEEEAEESQTEKNEDLLILLDQKDLLKSISIKTSKYDLNYYLDNLDILNDEFIQLLLKRFITVYSLTPLKQYLSPAFSTIDVRKHLIKIIKLIKIKLVEELIEDDSLLDLIRNGDREEILEIFNNIEPNIFMNHSMKFIDNDSLKRFITVIERENEAEYDEKI